MTKMYITLQIDIDDQEKTIALREIAKYYRDHRLHVVLNSMLDTEAQKKTVSVIGEVRSMFSDGPVVVLEVLP